MSIKRSSKKLTAEKAENLSMCLSVISFFVFLIAFFIMHKEEMEGIKDVVLLFLISLAIALALFIVLYMILGVDGRRFNERVNSADLTVSQNLTETEFTEVYFNYSEKQSDDYKILRYITESEECQFFVRLKNSECIELIAKDKHGEEVFNGDIQNFLFFVDKFRFEK